MGNLGVHGELFSGSFFKFPTKPSRPPCITTSSSSPSALDDLEIIVKSISLKPSASEKQKYVRAGNTQRAMETSIQLISLPKRLWPRPSAYAGKSNAIKNIELNKLG